MCLLAELVQKNNRTLVMVLHDLNLAAAFADQVIMLKDGKIMYNGSVEKVFNAANIKSVFNLDVDIIIDPTIKKTGVFTAFEISICLCVRACIVNMHSRLSPAFFYHKNARVLGVLLMLPAPLYSCCI